MRLWHKELIDVLPNKQLISQWRELCAIASCIVKNKTPNHVLVNKIMNYPIEHFEKYAELVQKEMKNRKFNISDRVKNTFESNCRQCRKYMPSDLILNISFDELYRKWHNNRYLIQCYYNLQEKYDCGGIDEQEWRRIRNKVVVDKEIRDADIYLTFHS